MVDHIKAMKAPFPWFGGKSKAAATVWQALGDPPNYVEPFAGSLAVLLGRPPANKRVETVNDLDCMIANFWRALQSAPDEVARHASNPVNEADLSARHVWLVNNKAELALKLRGTPDFYDAKVAGWWVWGQSCWIGRGWCTGKGPWNVDEEGRFARNAKPQGVWSQLPFLGGAGQGVNRCADPGAANLEEWFGFLATRLRYVRVCVQDWKRVVTPSATHRTLSCQRGKLPCGVFLDPPYSSAERRSGLYAEDDGDVAAECLEYCIKHTDVPNLRIVLAGFEGEGHERLESLGWRCVEWYERKGLLSGGMGNVSGDASKSQAHRDRLWLSPQCLEVDQEKTLHKQNKGSKQETLFTKGGGE